MDIHYINYIVINPNSRIYHEEKMNIVNVVNSIVGKKGNIGLRSSYIINELNKKSINNYSYSRGIVKGFSKNNKNMGVLGHVSRMLNAYRIYFDMWFNHRKYDIYLFEWFFNRKFKDIKSENKIAHIWEHSPKIIKNLKYNGWLTVLDVPIAPTATSIKLDEMFKGGVTMHPHQYNSNLELESYELSDKIIAPSIFVKDEIVKLGVCDKKITVVPFGSDLNNGYKKYFKKDFETEGVDFCFAGTVNKRKGIEFLLEAWNDQRFENDRLHLCGRLFPEIKKILKKYDFNNVILPGFVDTAEYFKKCDVYVFPSLLEGSSKSIYEAMSMSLPCIVTHNSGSVISDGEDGFIIDVANSSMIKNKMLVFKQDRCLIKKMGQAAFINSQKYSWHNYSKNVVNVYKQMSK